MNRKSLKAIVGIALALSLFLTSTAIVHAAQTATTSETGGGGTHALTLLSDQLSPKDGSENLQQQNVGIKLFFDGDVTDESVRELNGGKFSFTDAKGKVIPSEAYFYGRDASGYILLLVTPKATKDNKGAMLGNKTPYKLTIKSGLSSSDGRVLPEDITLSYRTVDMSGNTQVYMLLMVLMVVGMIGLTVFQNKRKAKAEAEVAAKEGKVNPYKLAKEKKISVQEAMAMIERDKQRRAKRLQKAGVEQGGSKGAKEAVPAIEKRDTVRVKRARPISEAGGTYRTGRKQAAEKKAKESAARIERARTAQNRKASTGKSGSRNKRKR